MAELTKIQLKTKTTSNDTVALSDKCYALEQGEPLFDKNTDRLYVGNDGKTTPAAEYLPSKGKNEEYEVTINTEVEGGEATTTLKVKTDNIDIDANVVTEGTSTFKDIATFEENLCAGSDSSVNIGASDKKFKDAYFKNVHGNVGTSTIYEKEMSGLFESTGAAKNATNADNIKDVQGNYNSLKDALLAMIYPIGSIYMSATATSPQEFLGGTWISLGQGRVPIGVDVEGNAAFKFSGLKGGRDTQTVVGVPKHEHKFTPEGVVTSTLDEDTMSGTTNVVYYQHRHSIDVNTANDGQHYHNALLSSDGDSLKGPTVNMDDEWGDYRYGQGNEHYDATHGCLVGVQASQHKHHITGDTGWSSFDHSHYITLNSNKVTSTFQGKRTSTDSEGTGATVSVLQPYITCYMWKRTG